MTFTELEHLIVTSFCQLSTEPLNNLDDESYYSGNYKYELINELQKIFDNIRDRGIKVLDVRSSQCRFCYPHGRAYSFHNPKTNEFIIRYVIAYDGKTEEGERLFRVEECRNRPIPDDIFGTMPF